MYYELTMKKLNGEIEEDDELFNSSEDAEEKAWKLHKKTNYNIYDGYTISTRFPKED